jgi:hypothetical protein
MSILGSIINFPAPSCPTGSISTPTSMVPQLYFSSYHIFLIRKQRVNDPFHQHCVAFFSFCGYEKPAFLVRHRRHFFDNDVDIAKQHAVVGDTASIQVEIFASVSPILSLPSRFRPANSIGCSLFLGCLLMQELFSSRYGSGPDASPADNGISGFPWSRSM